MSLDHRQHPKWPALWETIADQTMNQELPGALRNLNAMHVAGHVLDLLEPDWAAPLKLSATGVPITRRRK